MAPDASLEQGGSSARVPSQDRLASAHRTVLDPRTPSGRPRVPMRRETEAAGRGGVVRTRELHALGLRDQDIRIAVGYGNLRRIRNGRYALPATDDRLLEAVRLGGRLACVSALAFHDDTSAPAVVHIEIPANVPAPAAARSAGARIHWTRHPSAGGVALVDRAAAAIQAAACRASLEG